MKIICASYQCESNSKATLHPQVVDFEFLQGDDVFKKLCVKEIFEENGFTVVPSIYANAIPSGTVEQPVYKHFKDMIVGTVRENPDAAGIYIYVHGSMEVDGIGSGELQMLKEIREIVPRSCLIALVMDLHANITDELGDYADIVCGYKTAPHIDQPQRQQQAARSLAYCIKNGVKPYTYVQRIPMLVKGDTMLTKNEPLATLEAQTKALEDSGEVFGANMFFGHCWIDAPNTSASTVVSAKDKETAVRIAKEFANKLWQTRKEYRFLIEAESDEECVKRAIAGEENRIFITDSGDNTTAGAEGDTLGILKLLLAANPEKATCVAGITCPEMIATCDGVQEGEEVFVAPLGIKATLKKHGKILGWTKEVIGKSVTVTIGNIDVIFSELRSCFIDKANFDAANVDLLSYRIVVVKLGYLFEELKPFADRELFALTDGTSCVEVERLGLKKIVRPMYPMDEFEWEA